MAARLKEIKQAEEAEAKEEKKIASEEEEENEDVGLKVLQEALEQIGKKKGTLSDWLNEKHRFCWNELRAAWPKIPKKNKRRLIQKDKDLVKESHVMAEHPFMTESDDHCETDPKAYGDIVCALKRLAAKLKKPFKDLAIYDPYFCNGAVVKNLASHGFRNVYNKNEDFYAMKEYPPHDVVVTNPPYSSDHVERLLQFVEKNKKPAFLLMPKYIHEKPFFSGKRFTFVVPSKRYVYWTPKGLRPKEKRQNHASTLGIRTSPFISFWYVTQGLPYKELRGLYKKNTLCNYLNYDDLSAKFDKRDDE